MKRNKEILAVVGVTKDKSEQAEITAVRITPSGVINLLVVIGESKEEIYIPLDDDKIFKLRHLIKSAQDFSNALKRMPSSYK